MARHPQPTVAPPDAQGLDGRDAVDGGLAGDLDQVDGLDLERIVHCLELIAVEQGRLAVLECALRSRLREIASAERRLDGSGGDRFLTVAAAAARLQVDPRTIYKRRLPFLREITPGHWRVSAQALQRWMATRRQPRVTSRQAS